MGFDAVKMNATEELHYIDSFAKIQAVVDRVASIREACARISASLSTSTAVCISRWPRCWPMNWSPTS